MGCIISFISRVISTKIIHKKDEDILCDPLFFWNNTTKISSYE